MKNFKDKIKKNKNKKTKFKLPIQIIVDLDPYSIVRKGHLLCVYNFCRELYPGCYLYISEDGCKIWLEEGNVIYFALMRFLHDGIVSATYDFVFEV